MEHGLAEGETVGDSFDDFDLEHYLKEKTLKVLGQNRGVKLTTKTLSRLAQRGLRLIPPRDPYDR